MAQPKYFVRIGLDSTGDAKMETGSPAPSDDKMDQFGAVHRTELAPTVCEDNDRQMMVIKRCLDTGEPADHLGLRLFFAIDNVKALVTTSGNERTKIIEELKKRPELGHTRTPKGNNMDKNLITLARLMFPGTAIDRRAFKNESSYVEYQTEIDFFNSAQASR